MSDISVRHFTNALRSETVGGIARKLGFHWPPPPALSLRAMLKFAGTALVLSGGGAKGSFEIGVLKYLHHIGVRPSIICTTSVGSINGLKLAEGEGAPWQGFQGLEQLWLNMRTDSDMYVEDEWYRHTPHWIKGAVDKTASGPDFLGKIAIALIPFVGAVDLIDLKDFFDTIKTAHGIYNLQPIEDLARDNIDLQLLGGIRLRMTVVGLQSGAAKYVSESGRLLDDPALPSDDPNSLQVDIFKGMLASAAIPAIFEMQNLAGDWYVDGGVRQVAPVAAAIDMGATEVYAVVAPTPLAPDSDYTTKGLPDIGLRAATDIAIDQIITDNISPFRGWDVPVHIIRPNVEVEPSRTIDPGLIRINIAYGFMRAFDILSLRATHLDVQSALISLSDQIAITRKQIWELEEDLVWAAQEWQDGGQASGPNPTKTNPEVFADIRDFKNALLGLVQCRAGIAGRESMPADSANWAISWEAHQDDPTIISPSPWDATNVPPDPRVNGPVAELQFPAEEPQAIPPPGGCPQFR